jgi:hypothetical protein
LKSKELAINTPKVHELALMHAKDQLKDIPIDQVAERLGLGHKKHGGNLKGECP